MTAEAANEQPTAHEEIVSAPPVSEWSKLRTSEDWWAVWVGALILAIAFLAVYISSTTGPDGMLQVVNPIAPWVSTLGSWSQSPLDALVKDGESVIVPVLTAGAVILVLCGVGVSVMGERARLFVPAFAGVFALAVFAYLLASQKFIKHYGLEYPLWALLVGMTISNTIRTPNWMKPAVKTEFYIKTGLVLLGATILLWKLLALGVPGIFVAWVVTPIVLITTYWFGQRVLKISSRSLNMTISADMSVCGVSAAIATAAACRAKKEELSLAISLSLGFTVVMMIVLPAFINAVGMSRVLGGAWVGGTIDATGAVAAAGAFLGPEAENVAVTVKMIQNILIGVIAFGVAVYWVSVVEPGESHIRPSLWEIWYRFPKFVLGFVAASIFFSIIAARVTGGDEMVSHMIKGTTDVFRSWFFCLAFVCIGLETNFRDLAEHMHGGKPLVLYVVGQSLNLVLTLAMAWLMFEVVFRDFIQSP